MFEIELLNLKTNETFKEIFFSVKAKDNFVRKCKYSKKVKIITIVDWSYLYN